MDSIKKISQSVSTKVTEGGNNTMVAVVIALVLVVLVIAFIAWKLTRSKLRSAMILRGPRRLNNVYQKSAKKLPALSVGQEFSFSMWLFLTDFQAAAKHKLVLVRQRSGSDQNDINMLNPLVMLDRSTNRLHICIQTNRYPVTPPVCLHDILTATGANQTHLISSIEYIPLQRWVNVIFSFKDGLLTTFMDNSMYTVKSLQDMYVKGANPEHPLVGSISGDAIVGNFNKAISSDANGFSATIKFWNHALSSVDVKNVYESGPNSGGAFGFGNSYRLRSPIYKAEDNGESNDE